MNKNNLTIYPALLILGPSIILHSLATDIFVSCLPCMLRSLGTDKINIQISLTVFMLATGLGQIFAGPITDYFGRRKIMLASILLFLISSILCALSMSINSMIFFRLLQGLGACGTVVVSTAVVRDNFDEKNASKMYSYLNCAIAISPILGPIIGGYLLLWFASWRASFYFLAACSLVVLILVHSKLPETNICPQAINIKNLYSNYKDTVTNCKFLIFCFCATTALTVLFLFFSCSPYLFIDILEVNEQEFSYYFSIISIVFLVFCAICPEIEKKIGAINCIIMGSYFILIGTILMIIWDYIAGISIAGIMIPIIIIMIGASQIFGPCSAIALQPFKYIAGTAAAVYGVLEYCLSGIFSTIAMSFPVTSTLNLSITFLILSICNIIIIVCYSRSKNNKVSVKKSPSNQYL